MAEQPDCCDLVLCLPTNGFLASHPEAEEDARQRAEKSREEGGNGIKARQEGTGCRVLFSWVWLLVHPIDYPHYPVPGQMYYRKHF